MSQIGEAFVRVRPLATGFGPELDRQAGPGLRRFERQLAGTNRELGRFSRGALVGTGALGGLGRAAAFASTSFIGGAGLIFGIKSTIKAAMESQVVLGQTENAVKRAGLSWETYGEQIQKVALAQAQLSGFDDERLLGTFSTLVRRTGDVNEALKLNALAANIARGRNIELEQATQLVLKATLGMGGALRRLGIDAPKAATSLQLIQLLSEKYAGSAAKFADTAAGAQARFNVALGNTQETIGTALLPAITDLLDRGTAWLNQEKNQERIQRDVNSAVESGTAILGAFADALKVAKDVAEPLVDAVGGLKNAVELLLIAMAVGKITRFAAALGLVGPAAVTAGAGIATAETAIAGGGIAGAGIAGAAAAATTKVALLRAALVRLSLLGAITVTIYEVINRKGGGVTGFPKGQGPDFFTGNVIRFGTDAEMAAWAVEHLGDGGQAGDAARQILKKLGVNPATNPLAAGPVPPIGSPAGSSGGIPRFSGSLGPTGLAALTPRARNQLALTRAAGTSGTADDLKALAEQRLLLGKAIATETGRLENALNAKQAQKFADNLQGLQDQDNQALSQIQSIQEQAAQDTRDKAARIKAAAEKAASAREKAILDSVQIKERTLRTAVKASHDGKTADAALLAFYRKEAHDARLSGVARAEFAGKAVDEQQRENQVAKTRAETLRRGLVLGSKVIGDFLQEQLKARQRAAKAVETRLTLREGALGIARQVADLAVARAGDNEKLLGKAEAAERRADQRLIAFYKKRIAETRGLERQGYREKLIAAQLDLAGLKKEKAKATTGYTLDELFKEAGNQEALYGSNIGGADTPLSAQEAHGKFGGIVKTHQTVVVQNFYGPTRPNQAMNDARSSARNLK